MPAPPGKSEIYGAYPNPSNAVAKEGFGKLWDYVTGLLGLTGNASDARTALGAAPIDSPTFTTLARGPTEATTENSTKLATTAWAKVGLVVSLGTTSYVRIPTWLGGWIIQWGTSTGTTNGSSGTSVTYPLAFPTTAYAVLATNGDSATTLTNPIIGSGGTGSLSGFSAIWSTGTAGAGAGVNIRVNWVAFGR